MKVQFVLNVPQWSDQSREDLVSTVIISASRQGLLDLWERP